MVRGRLLQCPGMSLLVDTSFAFFDPVELSSEMVDGDLQLVPPGEEYLEEMLSACQHPQTRQQMPRHAETTRDSLKQFLGGSPRGLTTPDPARGVVPTYTFWLRVTNPNLFSTRPGHSIAGSASLRIAHTPNIELYLGHIGYHVFPISRGHRYAARACALLLGVARRHHFKTLWITCNPENHASRRTCEVLGAQWVGTVTLPRDNLLYSQGDREKCRYRLDLA